MSDARAFREEPAEVYLCGSVEGQLIDVREPAEYAAGSVTGAVNIPLNELPRRLGELDRQRPVVLLCRSGNRSRQAATYLAAAGFTDVINLAGGILSLSDATRLPASTYQEDS